MGVRFVPGASRAAAGAGVAFLLLAGVWSTAAPAEGPNAGGVLILHYEPSLKFTIDREYQGQSRLDDCAGAVTTVGSSTHPGAEAGAVLFVLAAFRGAAGPRVKSVTFTMEHTLATDQIVSWGAAGEPEASWRTSSAWPSSGSSFSIDWHATVTRRLFEVCWFGVQSTAEQEPGTITLAPAPPGFAEILDDAVPPGIDRFGGYGRLGFGAPGYNPCASVPVLRTSWGRIKIGAP